MWLRDATMAEREFIKCVFCVKCEGRILGTPALNSLDKEYSW